MLLEVKFWVEETVLYCKIIRQAEMFRVDSDSSIYDANGISFMSRSYPEIYINEDMYILFIRGSVSANDNITASYCFATQYEAVKTMMKYQKAVEEFNEHYFLIAMSELENLKKRILSNK